MTNDASNFHRARRAFIISESGLLIAPKNSDISHRDMLKMIGVPDRDLSETLAWFVRGYFMNGELCVYQGYNMTPGAEWKLTQNGKQILQMYTSDLRAIFNLNSETPVYMGVIVGEIGDVWKKTNRTTLKTLENQNILMYTAHQRSPV